MNLSQRLRQRPVLVEVIPPRVGANERQVDQALELVGTLVGRTQADAVNVPEIIGTAFQGMDPFEFGLLVRKRFGVEVVVNKVVVHQPREQFQEWVDGVIASDIASVILVGGERGGIYYPGPGVNEANRIARERAEAAGRDDFPVGNVTLPSRPKEALRMAEKVRSGCDYFTSQIVYDFPSANAHLQAYDDVSTLTGLEPKPVLYAFSPVESRQDVLFLRYLGVNIPPNTEQQLAASSNGDAAASLKIIEAIWTELLSAARARAVAVPLGIIAETVSRHNADAIVDLVRILKERLAELPASSVASAPATQT